MENPRYSSQNSRMQIGSCERREESGEQMEMSMSLLNFDIRSYQFYDLDLETAVNRLSQRDQKILILRLMGHNQRDIAGVSGLTPSMISRKLQRISNDLAHLLK